MASACAGASAALFQSSTKSSPMEQDSGNEQKIGSEQEKESSGGELW
jgi:hypothetical protein